MKKLNILMISLALFCLIATAIVIVDKSYSYGLTTNITGSKGSRVINYYDAGNENKITFQDAYNYYGVKKYDYYIQNNETIYFYQGKEISKNEYTTGHAAEEADERASMYGSNAYRVHNTEEFKKAIDDIFNSLKIGENRIEFSPYENINFTEIKNYYESNYGVTDIRQNYYPYKVKGPQEPDRFGLDFNAAKNNGELLIDTKSIRITGNERKVLEDFTNKLLPYLKASGTDYEKIYATYTYIKNTTTYENDNGFINNLLASNTSAYDALINRRTTCIGYSIAFSYLMDKLGIESYIIDNITAADPITHTFNSVHTWNIVKFNNLFYKVDLTGSNDFLVPVSSGELYNVTLPLAQSKYQTNQTVSIDYQAINRLLNESKSIKTTTTKRIDPTTTIKTYSYEMPNQGNKTTKQTPNQTDLTTTEPTTEKIITTTDEAGNVWIVTTDEAGNTHTITTNHENISTTTKSNLNTKEKKKFNLNFILFPLLFIIIIFLVVYKLKNRNKISINSSKVQDILNKDIQNKEENNNDLKNIK